MVEKKKQRNNLYADQITKHADKEQPMLEAKFNHTHITEMKLMNMY
jgi:hypothetical protein